MDETSIIIAQGGAIVVGWLILTFFLYITLAEKYNYRANLETGILASSLIFIILGIIIFIIPELILTGDIISRIIAMSPYRVTGALLMIPNGILNIILIRRNSS